MPSSGVVFTIGHSNHTTENFVGLLQSHGITAVADVRSIPYSRIQPQFNREGLAGALKKYNIDYVFLGKELGARSNDPACYENGQVQYHRLAQTEGFRSGLGRVCTGSENHRIALMYAEGEPLECHRTLLIGRKLEDAGIQVFHIHADGHVEPHEETIRRLLQRLGLPEQDLFQTRSELVDKAYSIQEARIAYLAEQLMP